MQVGRVSFWHEALGGLPPSRPALDGDMRADVCIVGAGYTGLWAAYYLARAQPGLEIVILEKEVAGFGASGRNGGWLTGTPGWPNGAFGGAEATMRAALAASVEEVLAVAATEGIEADIRRTCEITVATCPAQAGRAAEAARADPALMLLDGHATAAHLRVEGATCAVLRQGVARIQPVRLLRGLAAAVERRGVTILERTAATRILSGQVETAMGTVRAPVILRATEGFTARLHGHRRDWLPLNSALIVTEPLPDRIWRRIGWEGAELLGDFAHVYTYAQRTRDGRIALGGRGIPYRFGSRIDQAGEAGPPTIARLRARLERFFPDLRDHPLAHAWCGVLGLARDRCPQIRFDRATGLGHAGGYFGVGVATSNLAGRCLADMVLDRDTPLTRLPAVNRTARRWEPEPLRWLGVRGAYLLAEVADRAEAGGAWWAGPPGRLASRVIGH